MDVTNLVRFGRMATAFANLYDILCRKLVSEDDIDDVDKRFAALLESEHKKEILNSENGWLGADEGEIARAILTIQNIIRLGRTSVLCDQVRHGVEFYYSQLANPTFCVEQRIRLRTPVFQSYMAEEHDFVEVLEDKELFVWRIELIDVSKVVDSAEVLHHQRLVLARVGENGLVVETIGGWIPPEQMLQPDLYFPDHLVYHSGIFFEPI